MFVVVKAFSFAHDGVRVVRYEEGQQQLPADAAKVALSEGWAEEGAAKAVQSAPENKSTARKPKGKRS